MDRLNNIGNQESKEANTVLLRTCVYVVSVVLTRRCVGEVVLETGPW